MPIAAAAIPVVIAKSHVSTQATLESHCSLLTPAKNALTQLANAASQCFHQASSVLHSETHHVTSQVNNIKPK